MRIFIFVTPLILLLNACGDKPAHKSTAALTEINNQQIVIGLPPMPVDVYNQLFDNCDNIDYIFHELPISVSQDEKAAAQQTIGFIGEGPFKTRDATCKPIARKFFKFQGQEMLAADVYFSDKCKGYIFFKDNKPVYANQISASGVNFYNNIIAQASNMQQ